MISATHPASKNAKPRIVHRSMTHARTATLLAGCSTLVLGVGAGVGGAWGIVVALLLLAAGHGAFLWTAERLVLDGMPHFIANSASHPILVKLVERLARRAALPPPRVVLINSEQPNAFALARWRGQVSIALTRGLVAMLRRDELTGVLAHEIAHVRRRDAMWLTVTAFGAGVGCALLAEGWLVLVGLSTDSTSFVAAHFFAAAAAIAVQMAASRWSEYAADAAGAALCGQPDWIAGALERLERQTIVGDSSPLPPSLASAARLLGAGRDALADLCSTHPATSSRLRRLAQLAGDGDPWA
ncbi:MAG: hypothetical protein EXQ85_01650 [Alphaproteobacteria bacterium]|nr:hypothetical protein [Alphaproteobacteria bacterium]